MIRAPIDGIVISRLVDAGQTVAASLQAPELFVIAADLAKMRVIANIDESDVGRVRPNLRVTFTVDAFPADVFEGTVSQIRLEPIVTQNVVTYATVVDAPNPDLRLKPGMTATITLEVARRENVLRIPASALRFRPTLAMFATLNQRVPESMQLGRSTRPVSAPRGGGDARVARSPGAAPGDVTANRGFGESDALDPERRLRMRERLAQMSPEEREAFRERRLAARDGAPRGAGAPRGGGAPSNTPRVPTVERGATTIDALFGELPEVETAGLVWILQGDRLEGVPVRLGVTDGTPVSCWTVESLERACPLGSSWSSECRRPTTTKAFRVPAHHCFRSSGGGAEGKRIARHRRQRRREGVHHGRCQSPRTTWCHAVHRRRGVRQRGRPVRLG